MLVLAMACATSAASAQVTENFNARQGVAISQVKSYLQGKCWQFSNFDIKVSDVPKIEGDGLLVSKPMADAVTRSGIYTPLLNFNGNTEISFRYKGTSQQNQLNIFLVNANNEIIQQQDNVSLDNLRSDSAYTYKKILNFGFESGKVLLSYQHAGNNSTLAVDEISVSAPLSYENGCNKAPIGVNDLVKGTSIRTASGNVLSNDMEVDNENMHTYLLTDSKNGKVNLQGNGNFSFSPNPDWTGNTTSFTYQVCDSGRPGLCSNPVKVTLQFAKEYNLQTAMNSFAAEYSKDGVNVQWSTDYESDCSYYVIERSTDGEKFKKAGEVKGNGSSTVVSKYAFIDDMNKNVLARKDIYYRLRQVSADGKESVSKTLVARMYDTKTVQMLSVTPNPTENDIAVNAQLNENAFVVMKVKEENGAEVMRKSVRAAQGQNNIKIEDSNALKSGTYFLEIIVNSNERMTLKLVKG